MDRDRLQLDTPEGLTLELELAGPGSRGLAALLDSLVIGAVFIGSIVAFRGLLDNVPVFGLFSVSWMVAIAGYFVFFEVRSGGQTPGKRWTKIRVVSDDGGPVTVRAALLRTVARIVDFLPWGYFVGAVTIFVTQRNQRIGDLVAGTVVVHEVASTSTWSAVAPAAAARPEVGSPWDVSQITTEEVALIRNFLARRAELPFEARGRLSNDLARRFRSRVNTGNEHPNSDQLLEGIARRKT